MKKSQQVNSRRRNKMARNRKRKTTKSECHHNQCAHSNNIVIILLPAEMTSEENTQLRIAVDEILAPLGRPFPPLTWEEEKNGAIVVLPRSTGKFAIAKLSQLEKLGLMVVDGKHIAVLNFEDENMP